MPRFRRLVATLSPRRPGVNLRSVRVGHVVENAALGQVLLRVHRLSPVSIIPAMLHTHLNLHVALTRGTNWRINVAF